MTIWDLESSLTSYPHQWQRPAKTEEWVWEYLAESKHKSNFIEFISFPWATLIDSKLRNKTDQIRDMKVILSSLAPKRKLIRATVCQHVNLMEAISEFLELKITDIFWPHKVIGMDLIEGIRIHPFVLYPYGYYQGGMDYCIDLDSPKYLYSFLGAYDPGCYISNIREIIFRLQLNRMGFIKRRNSWHFENDVYAQNINGKTLSDFEVRSQKDNLEEYIYIMINSLFSLCPSGAGPNSIRYWESIAMGAVPVLLSDTWESPKVDNIYPGVKVNENSINSFVISIQKSYSNNRIKIDFEEAIFGAKYNRNIEPIKWLDSIFDDFFSNKSINKLLGMS